MNRQILSVLIMGLLLLFLFSPFAALGMLMITLFVATAFWMVSSLVQGVLTSRDESEPS